MGSGGKRTIAPIVSKRAGASVIKRWCSWKATTRAIMVLQPPGSNRRRRAGGARADKRGRGHGVSGRSRPVRSREERTGAEGRLGGGSGLAERGPGERDAIFVRDHDRQARDGGHMP